MRIGIFGSAFDPITVGHLCIVKTILKEFNFDKIILVPYEQTLELKYDIIYDYLEEKEIDKKSREKIEQIYLKIEQKRNLPVTVLDI